MRRAAVRFAIVSPYIFVFVTIMLGCITPGYDHLMHTISRLSIGKYGLIQSLNLLQLGIGLTITGLLLTKKVKHKAAKQAIKMSLFITAIVIFLLAVFPTMPFESSRITEIAFTPSAVVHFILVAIYLMLAPLGIYHLYRTFKEDPDLRSFARPTAVLGIIAFVSSLLWFVFFYFGILLLVRGLTQKIIILQLFIWYALLNKKLLRIKP